MHKTANYSCRMATVIRGCHSAAALCVFTYFVCLLDSGQISGGSSFASDSQIAGETLCQSSSGASSVVFTLGGKILENTRKNTRATTRPGMMG